MSTVILGAGIIGVSTAYYLSQSSDTPPESIHLVESSPRLFASASGYAAGFLARDWFSPSVASLGALSFDLHRQLAKEHSGRKRWGYSRSTGTTLIDGQETSSARGDDWLNEGTSRAEVAATHEYSGSKGPAWLTTKKGDHVEVISTGDTTAQSRGVQLHHPASAVSYSNDAHGTLSSIRIRSSSSGAESDLPCKRLIITAGAWTPKVFSALFPSAPSKIPVTSLAGHSLVIKSPRWTDNESTNGNPPTGNEQDCHAVFTTSPAGYSPEVFSRVGGEIYIAGLNSSSMPLPDLATDSKIDTAAIATLKETATQLLGLPASEKDDLEITRKGLCFRPVTRSGRPIVWRVPDAKLGKDVHTNGSSTGGEGGVFVSAGHGPWGITMSLGTGKVLAEMVEGKESSADVGQLGL
ncbi:MAG: glycine decarboxylase subunit P [Chaenotheca gracillima]|nr:MAG: glycine decarboxylase subunit P [Chaenotheca gracillima]